MIFTILKIEMILWVIYYSSGKSAALFHETLSSPRQVKRVFILYHGKWITTLHISSGTILSLSIWEISRSGTQSVLTLFHLRKSFDSCLNNGAMTLIISDFSNIFYTHHTTTHGVKILRIFFLNVKFLI